MSTYPPSVPSLPGIRTECESVLSIAFQGAVLKAVRGSNEEDEAPLVERTTVHRVFANRQNGESEVRMRGDLCDCRCEEGNCTEAELQKCLRWGSLAACWYPYSRPGSQPPTEFPECPNLAPLPTTLIPAFSRAVL